MGGAGVARARSARGRRRGQRAALARAVRLQPGADAVHRRPGHAHRPAPAALLHAIAAQARFETRLATPVAAVRQRDGARRGRDAQPASCCAAARGGRGGAAEHAGGDRVRAGAVRAQAGGDRARPGLARHQDLRPRRRRARTRRTRSGPGTVRLPGHRDRARDDGSQIADRLRPRRRAPATPATCRAVQRAMDEILPGYAGARRDRPRLAGRRVLARHVGDPPARLVHAPPRRDAAARGSACCWPAPTSPTAGRASSTAPSSRGCRRGAWALRGRRERPRGDAILEATLAVIGTRRRRRRHPPRGGGRGRRAAGRDHVLLRVQGGARARGAGAGDRALGRAGGRRARRSTARSARRAGRAAGRVRRGAARRPRGAAGRPVRADAGGRPPAGTCARWPSAGASAYMAGLVRAGAGVAAAGSGALGRAALGD